MGNHFLSLYDQQFLFADAVECFTLRVGSQGVMSFGQFMTQTASVPTKNTCTVQVHSSNNFPNIHPVAFSVP